jgi:HSP20 family molecular chaperone IbpA
MFDEDMFRMMPGYGRAWTSAPMPQFPDFTGLFDGVFEFVDDDSSVVRVFNVFDLEKQDIEVSINGDMVTVKGEYSADLGATRIYEQFQLPEGKQIKTTQFIKNATNNKLVILFEDKGTDEFVSKTETQTVE